MTITTIDDFTAVKENTILTATGNVLANDSGTNLTIEFPGLMFGAFGHIQLFADGSYVYTLQNDSPDVQSLNQGDVVEELYPYVVTDGQAESVGWLTVQIAGSDPNSAPVTVDDSAMVREDLILAASGNVLLNDSDPDAGTQLTVASAGLFFGAYGRLNLAADGSYTYTLDNAAAQSLAQGEVVQEVFQYAATDNIATTIGLLTVSIVGTNEAPVTVEDTAGVQEDAILTASGNVLANDSDPDGTAPLSVVNTGASFGAYGRLDLAADGSYTYTLDNAAAQTLRRGEVVQEVFQYAATDNVDTTIGSLTINVVGSNEAPVTTDDTTTVREDVILTASGNVLVNDSDPDGTTLTVVNTGSSFGAYGRLDLAADGSYTYTLDNAAAQSLRQGEVVQEVFQYAATDNVDTTIASLTVNIVGTNEAPVTTDDAASVREDAILTASGNVLLNDTDPDGGTLSVANFGAIFGAYGRLDLAADGSYTYTLDNAAAQSLRQGEMVQEVFQYAATDNVDTTIASLTVDIVGSNEAPLTTDDAAIVQEDVTLTASGNVLLNDTDPDGSALSVANVGLIFGAYGRLDLAADGSYVYTLDNAAAQSLRQGEIAEEVYQYVATDGFDSSFGSLTVQIAGSDEAPVTANDVASVREDVTLGATGNVLTNDTDADSGVLSVTAGTQAGAYGTLALNADGSYTYTLANDTAAVQLLCGGQVVSDTFSYSASDGIDSTPGALTISVLGSNDTPVLANSLSDQDAQVGAEFTLTAPANTFRDIDLDDALTYSAHTAAGAALPSWLSFDPTALRFSGTPGTADAGMLQVRLTATDISGASADDMFAIDVTSANHDLTFDFQVNGVWPNSTYDRENVGSPGVKGTHQDVSIDGKNRTHGMYVGGDGSDTLNGTSGSDALLLDDSASPRPAGTSGPRMVSIETINMGAGNDVVDLTSTRYTYGDVTVNGGSGRDTLWTNAGDDVLDGGTGNDTLAGGAGDDVYVHQANGGDDVITETSGNDTILFGPGITSRSVTVRRDDNDLVLSAGDNGSVTVRNWFGSTSRRVETVQFADGSAWSEAQLSMRANCGSYGWDFGSSTRIAAADRPNRRDSDDDDDRHRSKDDHRVKDAAEVVAALLSQKTRYDFSALAAFMSRRYGDSNGRPLSAAEVSLKWRALQRFAQGLANVDKYAKEALLGRGHADDLLQVAAAAMGWGYEGSTGSERAAGGMSSLHGLAEGFKRL